MLGPSSGVKLSSNTILFVKLPYANIHASHSQFSNPPGSGVNLTPEPDTTPLIALFNKRTSFSEAFNFRQSHTCLQKISQTVKTGYLLVHIPATHHCGGGATISWVGGRGLSVSEVNLTPEPGRRAQHEFRFTSMETIFKYT